MKKIYKYNLAITDTQKIMMPQWGNILSVQIQEGVLCIWVLVDPEELMKARNFAVIGTGNPIDAKLIRPAVYIGSVQDFQFVWHVFDLGYDK